MNNIFRALMVITSTFLVSQAEAKSEFGGQVVTDSIQVGSFSVPLPEGQWLVLEQKTDTASRSPSMKKRSIPGFYNTNGAVLVQVSGNTLGGIIRIDSYSDFENEEFSGRARAALTNAYFAENFYVPGAKKLSTVSVEPYHYNTGDFHSVVSDFVAQNRLSIPYTAFVDVKFALGSYGRSLRVEYIFNPIVEGVRLRNTQARLGDWTFSRKELLPVEAHGILSSYAGWAQGFKSRVIAGFVAN